MGSSHGRPGRSGGAISIRGRRPARDAARRPAGPGPMVRDAGAGSARRRHAGRRVRRGIVILESGKPSIAAIDVVVLTIVLGGVPGSARTAPRPARKLPRPCDSGPFPQVHRAGAAACPDRTGESRARYEEIPPPRDHALIDPDLSDRFPDYPDHTGDHPRVALRDHHEIPADPYQQRSEGHAGLSGQAPRDRPPRRTAATAHRPASTASTASGVQRRRRTGAEFVVGGASRLRGHRRREAETRT